MQRTEQHEHPIDFRYMDLNLVYFKYIGQCCSSQDKQVAGRVVLQPAPTLESRLVPQLAQFVPQLKQVKLCLCNMAIRMFLKSNSGYVCLIDLVTGMHTRMYELYRSVLRLFFEASSQLLLS